MRQSRGHRGQRSVPGGPCLVVVQLLSHVQLFVTPWTAACQASLSFIVSQSLLKLIQYLVMPSSSPSSVIPFSSCLQSFPASGSFPVSWLFTNEVTFEQNILLEAILLVFSCFFSVANRKISIIQVTHIVFLLSIFHIDRN